MKTVQLQIKRANSIDVVENGDLKKGVTYYVQSIYDPETFCGPLVTTNDTNKTEFSYWYSYGRIYVPVSALLNKIRVVSGDSK